jgi:glutathione S-transferase
MPADSAREARTLEWMNWLSGWVHAVAFAQQWRPERFSADATAHPGIRAKGRCNMLEAFRAIERITADGRRWAVPDAFTIADAFLLVFYRWGGVVEVDMAQYVCWTALTNRTMQRASVRTAFRREGLPRLTEGDYGVIPWQPPWPGMPTPSS